MSFFLMFPFYFHYFIFNGIIALWPISDVVKLLVVKLLAVKMFTVKILNMQRTKERFTPLKPRVLFTRYIPSSFQQITWVLKGKKHIFKETEQASEPDSDTAGILELSNWEFILVIYLFLTFYFILEQSRLTTL